MKTIKEIEDKVREIKDRMNSVEFANSSEKEKAFARVINDSYVGALEWVLSENN